MDLSVCRICLIKTSELSIYEKKFSDLSTYDMIFKFSTIRICVEGDYPNGVCYNCYKKVENAILLKQEIEKSEINLKEIFQSRNSNIKEEILFSDTVVVEYIEDQVNEAIALNNEQCEDKYSSSNPELKKACNSKSKKKIYECKECGKVLNSLKKYDTHLTSHTGKRPYECETCGKTYANTGCLHIHKKTHSSERPFICEVCSKQFLSKTYLKQHQITHAPDSERLLYCEKCNKVFRTKRFLNVHLKKHEGIRDALCKECGKNFFTKKDLARHIRTVHLSIKNHTCSKCLKTFSNSGNLIAHFRVHTGEKPYECKYCDSRFNQSTPLVRHTKRHIDRGDVLKIADLNYESYDDKFVISSG